YPVARIERAGPAESPVYSAGLVQVRGARETTEAGGQRESARRRVGVLRVQRRRGGRERCNSECQGKRMLQHTILRKAVNSVRQQDERGIHSGRRSAVRRS